MTDSELLETIIIRKIHAEESIPYQLLLDADPSWTAISKYLENSEIYVALLKGEIIASMVLYPVDQSTLEIKNIAVNGKLQRRGIG